MTIYLRAPRTLGEGLRRVVKEAGNGTPGKLKRITEWGYKSPVREYTNGVVIASGYPNGVAIGLGAKLKAFVKGITAEKQGWFQKFSGWINGKQKHIKTEIDIYGNHTNRSVTKGKNALKNVQLLGGNALETRVRDGEYALKQAKEAIEKAMYA